MDDKRHEYIVHMTITNSNGGVIHASEIASGWDQWEAAETAKLKASYKISGAAVQIVSIIKIG